MIIKDQSKISDDIVKVSPIMLQGFPLVSLTEEHLTLKHGYKFSNLTYERPSGENKTGHAKIELINSAGDVLIKQLTFDFEFTEKARIQDAKKQESFKITPTALMRRDPQAITKLDIVPKYEDVIINKIEFNNRPFILTEKGYKKVKGQNKDASLDEFGYILIKFSFVNDRENILSIQLPVSTFGDADSLNEISSSKAININSLKVNDDDVNEGLAKTIDDLTRFQIRPGFLNGAPPLKVGLDILVPGIGVSFRKVEYYPPKSVRDKLAFLQVEYYYNNRIYNERVKFLFAISIQESVEALIRTIPLSDFEYTPKKRTVLPTYMKATDFRYIGELLEVEIDDVIYNHNEIDHDERYVTVDLIVTYRMVKVVVRKKLEFRYSKNEYIEGRWRLARTENGSIRIDKKFHDALVLYNLNEGDKKLQKEIVKTATIVEGYPYNEIVEIKVVNFDVNSHYAMFKVTAIEVYGDEKAERTFEKWIELKESYNEALLNDLLPEDIEIDMSILPDYPPNSISERCFIVPKNFNLLSIQYETPEEEEKEMDIELKIGTGNKTVFISKTIKFNKSYKEYRDIEWNYDIEKYLYQIDPSTISINIDTSGMPITQVTKDMVTGIPSEVSYDVFYKPPKVGARDTRIIIKLKKGDVKIAFEQTIIFNEARRRGNGTNNIETTIKEGVV